jgi:hypothetical protein
LSQQRRRHQAQERGSNTGHRFHRLLAALW